MSDRPLHVQVAEALGWTEIVEALSNWLGKPPAWDPSPHHYIAQVDHVARSLTVNVGSIPRYDTDWSATGPLIERYGISVLKDFTSGWHAAHGYAHTGVEVSGIEENPLTAVCLLIVAQAAAGKLPK